MPNYGGHKLINCFAAGPIAYGTHRYGLCGTDDLLLAGVSFLFATFLLSPDLDLRHSRPTKNWGILRILWYGYPKFFRHRGLSHSLLFSGLTKFAYLTVVGSLGYFIFYFFRGLISGHAWLVSFRIGWDHLLHLGHQLFEWALDHQREIALVLAGVCIADWVHILTDKIFSFVGGARRKFSV